MKTCPNCGNQVADEVLFCNNCGSSLANAVANNGAPADMSAAQGVPQMQAPNQPYMNGAQPYGNPQQAMDPNYMNMQAGMNGQMNYQQPYPQAAAFADPTDHTSEFDAEDLKENKLYGILPYISFAIGIIVCVLRKDSKYCQFHAKNALKLTLFDFIAFLACLVPLVGWILSPIILLVVLFVNIIAIVYAFQGRAKDIPIVRSFKFLN